MRAIRSVAHFRHLASFYFKQIALALQACHRKYIVHRDVKMENLMLVGQANPGRIKLVDFGLAVICAERKKFGLAGSANCAGFGATVSFNPPPTS